MITTANACRDTAPNNICCNCDAATADGNGECCTFCASGTGNCTRREASCRTGQCLNDTIGGFSPVSGGQSPANNSSPAGNNNSSGCSSSKLLATGGNITYYGDYTIHTFTSSGTFRVTNANLVSVDVLVVGGGGGRTAQWGGGGGGAVQKFDGRAVTKRSYTVTVGAGGPPTTGPTCRDGVPGGNSSFDYLVANGGGSGTCSAGAAIAARGSSGKGWSGGINYAGAC